MSEKIKRNIQKRLEENKETLINTEKLESDDNYIEYPEECKVLDIMRNKYYDVISFYYDTEDKN